MLRSFAPGLLATAGREYGGPQLRRHEGHLRKIRVRCEDIVHAPDRVAPWIESAEDAEQREGSRLVLVEGFSDELRKQLPTNEK